MGDSTHHTAGHHAAGDGAPRITLIAALAENRVIGIENRLPWHLPGDMQWFRRHTLGKPVLMGRNTFLSLGRPLPQRHNIVLTTDAAFQAEGATAVHSIEAALQAAGAVSEVMIIGGESFYRQMLPQADRLILTLVHAAFDGDAWFPEFDPLDWEETERVDCPADDTNPHSYSFLVLQKRHANP